MGLDNKIDMKVDDLKFNMSKMDTDMYLLQTNLTQLQDGYEELSGNLSKLFPNGTDAITPAPTVPITSTTTLPPIIQDSVAQYGKIFIVGGYDATSSSYLSQRTHYTTEVVDIIDDGVTPCNKQHTFYQ